MKAPNCAICHVQLTEDTGVVWKDYTLCRECLTDLARLAARIAAWSRVTVEEATDLLISLIAEHLEVNRP